jgi:hypothetical protein
MDTEEAKKLINEFFENRPTKDVYEKCLLELITEKHNIVANEEYEKDMIDRIDKVIESIEAYLYVTKK